MRTCFYLFFLLLSIRANGQIEHVTKVLEPAILECKYQCTQLLDTLGSDKATDIMILRIGKKSAQFYASSTFYADSLYADPTGKRLWSQLMMQSIRTRNYAQMPRPKITNEYIYKDYTDQKIRTLTTLGMTDCLIEEAHEPQEWMLTDSTRTILGYECRSAECNFRGRHYKAWFTLAIPLNEGPWKFNGLPGLILEVYDIQKHYHYTLIGIKQKEIEPVSYYKFEKKVPEKINRINYLKLKAGNGNKGINPEIKEALKLDNTSRNKKNAQGQNIAYDLMEKDYR